MTLIRQTEVIDQPGRPRRYVSQAELEIRNRVEEWGRAKWPNARVVHELVMDRGTVRADVAFVGETHFAVVEIKSEFDSTERLMHQAAMFRLASPELWIIADQRHDKDIALVRYLLPSVGHAVAVPVDPVQRFNGDKRIEERTGADQFAPHPTALLSLLWVAELSNAAVRYRVAPPKTHAKLVAAIERALTPAEQIEAVCHELRRRNAMWRADPPLGDSIRPPTEAVTP